MAQPEPYQRQFDFTGFQSVSPTAPLPGDKVDLELNTAKITLDQILQNLSLIQRDDGRLMNGSVGQEQLAVGLSIGFTFKGVWAAGKVYALGDGVSFGAKFYRAKVSHSSDNTSRPDISALFWEFLFDFSALVQQGFSPNARSPVADANYSVLITDRLVAYTSITAPRVVALPAASAFPNGVFLGVVDESGSCSGVNTITINRAGSDTIGGATSYVLNTARAFVFFESDGASKWTVVVASALPDNTVSTAKIVDQAVTTAKIADGAVTAVKVPNAGLPTNKLSSLGGLPGLHPIGGEIPWPGLFAPAGWLIEQGQAVSRATYATLFAAMTVAATANIANGNNVLSNVNVDFTGTGAVGGLVEGPGIPLGTFINSVTSTTITLSQNATAGATGAAIRIFPQTFGQGDGSTTFTLPDPRGFAIVGREQGTTRITGAFDSTRLGNSGGEAAHVTTTAEMPAHNHPASSSPHHHNTGLALAGALGATTNAPVDDASASNGHALTSDTTVSVTTSNTGGGLSHNNVQPSVTRNIIIYAGV